MESAFPTFKYSGAFQNSIKAGLLGPTEFVFIIFFPVSTR